METRIRESKRRRVPVETRLAPNIVRTGSSPLTGAASVTFARQLAECFAPQSWAAPTSDKRHAPTTRLGLLHGEGASPCGNPAGIRCGHADWDRLRPGEVQNTRCATTAEVKILHWGPLS